MEQDGRSARLALFVTFALASACGARTEPPGIAPVRDGSASTRDAGRDGAVPGEDGGGPGDDGGLRDSGIPCVPSPEVCDFADNDCDGRTDEGTRNECNDCRPDCELIDVPGEVAASWEEILVESPDLSLDPAGRVVLSEESSSTSYGWIANTAEATITKIDLDTGAQTAEYDSALVSADNGARPAGERCNTEDRGNCPSRTAVDLRGAVYVANRAFGNQGTVTKIAGREEDCVDRDGDGLIDTARDENGNGRIESREFRGQEDECILWTRAVGGSGGIPRAIAIDATGAVWVGLNGAQRVLQLDPDTGETRRDISLARRGFSPYGAVVASDGTLWMTEGLTGRIMSVNTSSGTAGLVRTVRVPGGCAGSYGIAIDGSDRVWVAGFNCDAAFRYTPSTNTWAEVRLPNSGVTRGIAVDDRGFVYVGSSHTFIDLEPPGPWEVGDPISRLTRFRADDLSGVEVFGLPGDPLPGLATVGVGLDNERRVWMVNQDSGTATRFDPDTRTAEEFPVGEQPYTYSDFTGFTLRTFTAPSGTFRTQLSGCAFGPTEWERLEVNAMVPAGARVETRLRSAPTEDRLDTAPWTPAASGSERDLSTLGLDPNRFLELEVTLIRDGGAATPRLESVRVQRNCPI